jgi:hypothetical protein
MTTHKQIAARVQAVELAKPQEPAGRSCLSGRGNPKRRFPTKRLAKDAAAKNERVYACPDCRQWHIAGS